MAESKSTNKKTSRPRSGTSRTSNTPSRPRRRGRDRFDIYGPAIGGFRRTYGRKKTYLLFLVGTIFLCGLLYFFYWLDMKH